LALRAAGMSQVRTFQTYHRVLSRAVCSSVSASRVCCNFSFWRLRRRVYRYAA
jgi:hypothetical protein